MKRHVHNNTLIWGNSGRKFAKDKKGDASEHSRRYAHSFRSRLGHSLRKIGTDKDDGGRSEYPQTQGIFSGTPNNIGFEKWIEQHRNKCSRAEAYKAAQRQFQSVVIPLNLPHAPFSAPPSKT